MTSSPRNATELMVQYARYHRDRRNIATHFLGIPLIVFAVGILLSKPAFTLAGLTLTPAWIAWGLATIWYFSKGNAVLALAVSLVNGVLMALAHMVPAASMVQWLGWGIGTFVVGWALQFAGHYYEGKKPAFVDDLVGLLVGPMFVTGELLFALGWGKSLLAEIEQRTGPTVIRTAARPQV